MKRSLLITLSACIAITTANAQVTQINNNNSLHVTIPLNNVKTIVVSDTDGSIWVTEGTAASTFQISPDIVYENSGGVLSGKFIFEGSTAATGSELYITDGTIAGTGLLADIYAGVNGSEPSDFTTLNGIIYFSAATLESGRELWRTDGTLAGTFMVKDIVDGPTSSNQANRYDIFSSGSYLLFAANTAAEGLEIWKSDGTNAGTAILKNINAGADSSNPRNFYLLNGIVLFSATDAATGDELWRTDGTIAGTQRVQDINVGPASSTTLELIPGFPIPLLPGFHTFNNRAYFLATDGTSTGQVWSTNGAVGDATLLKNIVDGISYAGILLIDAVNFPSKFIFPVTDGENRSELWQSDGTPDGTTILKSFTSITPGDLPTIAVPFTYNISSGTLGQSLFTGNRFFFIAPTMTEGYELWVSDGVDGTAAHTSMVKDINPGIGHGLDIDNNISYLYTANTFFFAANDGMNGNELWKTDGTLAGTTMVQDINLNAGDANPELTLVNNGKIIFSATDGNDPVETDLFVVDGSFTPLPVKLTNFSVSRVSKDALLQWTTSLEINVSNFTVQRSYDAVHFENLGIVQAAGTSANSHAYTFTDQDIASSGKPILYYRLLTTDNDGKTEFSNVVVLKLGGKQWSMQLLGNPVKDNINLILAGATNVHVSIRDITGKQLYSKNEAVANGSLSIPVSKLPHGFYVLSVTNGDERRSIRFVK